ncbi:MAG: aspartate carbamoyltransferase catalytic subunit [Alphaproteobacteria bacterium]|nr:aspartate carbamoyltransferase catalytic subunit [Alphaproteobacteria bacterium]MCK5556640.1 aspartate carbamoyltransferase catalytic subunit [Alphaproteobacteria bacterium]MCK5659461.1 aspartate carbamoyltransferase catalytic subunit [Alphaproteobacteria bacterium]
MSFSHRDFLGIEVLNADEISFILDLAERYVVQNRRRPQTNSLLKGFVMINLFLENSTRTRLSFEMAAKRLGADVINMTTEGSSIKKGESFIDTLKTLNSLCPDIFVVRSKEEGAARTSAEIMECPVINAGDGTNEHPTQAMLDALTLRRHFGRLDGLNIAICGDIIHGRVAHSNVLLLEKMGVHIKLVGPSELLPPNLENATTDMQEGLKDADAVMVLRIQEERLQKSLSFTSDEYFKSYGLTEEKLAWAKKDAVVLHPGPILRGAEIDATIADNPKRSLVTTQVEMGIAVRMACLDLLTRYKR